MIAKIPSQRERLIAFFDSGKTLTRLTAWDELGILEAPARISELRSANYPIVTKMITVKNRYGEYVRVAEWKKNILHDGKLHLFNDWTPIVEYKVGDVFIRNGEKCIITDTSDDKLWSEK